jgi:predicted small secreted protein
MLALLSKPRQEMSMKNKVFLVMLLSIAALSAGCNTVAGAGKDIQRGGEKIEGAATK